MCLSGGALIMLRNVQFRKKYKLDFKNSYRNFSSNDFSIAWHVSNPKFNYVNNKLRRLFQWYEEISGIQDVKLAQTKAVEAEEKLHKLKTERLEVYGNLAEVQAKLRKINAELQNTQRGNSNYVALITEEYNWIQQEEALKAKFQLAEKAERNQFYFFTSLVKNSFEKERVQSQKMRFWSLVGSLVGTLLGIIGASINNYFRDLELEQSVKEMLNSTLKYELQQFQENLKVELEDSNNSILENLSLSLNEKLTGWKETIIKTVCGTKYDTNEASFMDQPKLKMENVFIKKENIKKFIITASAICLLIPVISKIY